LLDEPLFEDFVNLGPVRTTATEDDFYRLAQKLPFPYIEKPVNHARFLARVRAMLLRTCA